MIALTLTILTAFAVCVGLLTFGLSALAVWDWYHDGPVPAPRDRTDQIRADVERWSWRK